ncbi:MAG TPA: hypothetical protein VLA19_29385 [Herpetosiphonaceae bacterium]|nr:hypothetical protein [Herpetosiphonaceae bacterium]
MRPRRDSSEQAIEEYRAPHRAGNGTAVRHVDGVAARRIVEVGDARTIVVRPRIPSWYKALLGLSLALNLLVLLVLFLVGGTAYRFYRALGGEINALAANTPAEERLASLGRDPAAAADFTVNTARQGVGETLAAMQELENATIRGQIPIDQQLPLQLTVPVDTNTTVSTNAPVPLAVPAQLTLPGGGGALNGIVSFSLPAGLQMPVHLGFTVPVSGTVPAKFDVPVNIPLRETELSGPFARLRQMLEPAAAFLRADER